MKHSVKISLPLALVLSLALLVGCSSTVRSEDLAGKSYVYEKDGFGSDFVINLEEDGSFTYYEGSLSSYIGTGEWTVEKGVLILEEKHRVYTFGVKGEALIFRQEGSGDFLYVDVHDGEKFTAEG